MGITDKQRQNQLALEERIAMVVAKAKAKDEEQRERIFARKTLRDVSGRPL